MWITPIVDWLMSHGPVAVAAATVVMAVATCFIAWYTAASVGIAREMREQALYATFLRERSDARSRLMRLARDMGELRQGVGNSEKTKAAEERYNDIMADDQICAAAPDIIKAIAQEGKAWPFFHKVEQCCRTGQWIAKEVLEGLADPVIDQLNQIVNERMGVGEREYRTWRKKGRGRIPL